jgi:heptosyltransferase-2
VVISTMPESNAKELNIVVLPPNYIGDAVLSLPLLDACYQLWPEANLTVLARAQVAELFEAREPEVRVLEYERGNGPLRVRNLISLGRRLRMEGFELAFLLPNSLSSAIIARLAGVPQRVGYSTDGRGWLLTQRLEDRRKERGLHQVDYYLGLLHGFGVSRMDRIPHLKLKQEVIERGLSLLDILGIENNELLVGVHPGASYGETKKWFPERFAQVMDLLQKPGRRFVLLGGPGEEPLAERISAIMASSPINTVGKTTVAEALALVSRCGLFLGNDSGLMHAAAALGVPQVALFGSTDPEKTAPLNDKAVVIHPQGVSCTPCFKSKCPENLECMKAITVDEVYVAAEKLLES